MKPVIALVGRPNVGKSSLFNRLTRTRNALVADRPGLTRDRIYGNAEHDGRGFIVVDTGGLTGEQTGIGGLMAAQAAAALAEATRIFFLVDGRGGLNPDDQEIARDLRKYGKPVLLVVNKTEGLDEATAVTEFHAIGIGKPYAVSAEHGDGVAQLMDAALAGVADDAAAESDEVAGAIRVAVVGRPNAGKSTLINRCLGEERVLTFDEPGTTRDSVFIPFERDGVPYTLIDTAGVRRRARVEDVIEKFSVIKTMQAIDAAHVVIAVLDAHTEVAEQDLRLLGEALDSGRALIVAVNKWDNLDPDKRDYIKKELDRRLVFVSYAEVHFISALHGTGVGDLFDAIQRAYASVTKELPTPDLTEVLERAVDRHQPPLVRGRRIKLRYAHQGGSNPPTIVIHGNQTQYVPDAYRRYLENCFRNAFQLIGAPVRLVFKSGTNPYAGKKNSLTERQQEKRRRLMRHAKR